VIIRKHPAIPAIHCAADKSLCADRWNIVVFQQLLADVEVARFNLALRRFDRARNDCRSIGSPSGILSRS